MIKILEIGDVLKNLKTNKLHQITNITTTAVFIKRINGNITTTAIRYTNAQDITDNFEIYCK